jgi:hypothetical protein
MTRYFMRDTPLYQLEQMMMTPPNFRPRGHGLHPSRFHYQTKDVECRYCTNHAQDRLCPLCECICFAPPRPRPSRDKISMTEPASSNHPRTSKIHLFIRSLRIKSQAPK